MTAPKINLGMDDEPVERNRQLREKDDCREPAERRHAGILVEWRVGDNIFVRLGVRTDSPRRHKDTEDFGAKRPEGALVGESFAAHIVGAIFH